MMRGEVGEGKKKKLKNDMYNMIFFLNLQDNTINRYHLQIHTYVVKLKNPHKNDNYQIQNTGYSCEGQEKNGIMETRKDLNHIYNVLKSAAEI